MSIKVAATRALAFGVLLAAVSSGLALGYAGQVAATVSVSGPSAQQSCGVQIAVSALVEDAQGSPISGQPVTWSFNSGSVSGDKLTSASASTGSTGVATTHAVLACTPHTVVIGAVADLVSGTVSVTTTGRGLPRTDVAADTGTTSGIAVALAAVAVLLGAGIILRRLSANRR